MSERESRAERAPESKRETERKREQSVVGRLVNVCLHGSLYDFRSNALCLPLVLCVSQCAYFGTLKARIVSIPRQDLQMYFRERSEPLELQRLGSSHPETKLAGCTFRDGLSLVSNRVSVCCSWSSRVSVNMSVSISMYILIYLLRSDCCFAVRQRLSVCGCLCLCLSVCICLSFSLSMSMPFCTYLSAFSV